MNARVGKSSDISHSLGYAQNREKDGGILFANFTDLSTSPEEQAQDWTATANDYKTQCYTIVISFTTQETAILRSMPDNGRDKVRTIIKIFLMSWGTVETMYGNVPISSLGMTTPTMSIIISLSGPPTSTAGGFTISS